MVLPDRIELSTSPLPMECSTTELRQRARIAGIGQIGPTRRPILATRPPLAQARGSKGRLGLPPVQRGTAKVCFKCELRADPVPLRLAQPAARARWQAPREVRNYGGPKAFRFIAARAPE
jgi:hypothetical protein